MLTELCYLIGAIKGKIEYLRGSIFCRISKDIFYNLATRFKNAHLIIE